MNRWNPKKADLFLSLIITLILPYVAGKLFFTTGALLPMAIYYFIAWCLPRWRRGATGYSLKGLKKPPLSFYIHILIIVITLILSYKAKIVVNNPDIRGVLLTGALWAIINASSEQLLWLYIFDSWDLYKVKNSSKLVRWLLRSVAILFFTIFVGTIHTMFWAHFLHTIDPELFIGKIFIIGTSISGYLHIVVWRRSGRMIYTFIPHFLLNLFPLFWTGYSIIPYLFK